MRVLITLSHRFVQTPDGQLWTANHSFAYPVWQRYLDVFDDATLLSRAQPAPMPPANWHQATGPGVGVLSVPNFRGILGMAQAYLRMRTVIKQALREHEAIILRAPSPVSSEVWRHIPRTRPYAVEVIGDPYDSFAPGSVKHPLRPLLRRWFAHVLREECAHASAVSYVTEQALQQRYPPGGFTTHYSSILLNDDGFVAEPRRFHSEARRLRLIYVGTMAQLYKAPDVLLDAVAQVLRGGANIELVMIGGGDYQHELEQRARDLQIAERVSFLGHLASSLLVRAELDQADLFVLPSRQEGLPRAMVEAMARGLPCIGSTVGGIPELLEPPEMVPPGDAVALARTIQAVIADPARMERMSARNLQIARKYSGNIINTRRQEFYRQVRAQAEAAQSTRHPKQTRHSVHTK